MTYCIAHNIFSPLGFGSEENYASVKSGISGLAWHDCKSWMLAEPIVASLLDDDIIEREYLLAGFTHAATRFEKMVLVSAHAAIVDAGIDVTGDDVQLVLATTKGNIALLDAPNKNVPYERVLLSETANFIKNQLGVMHTPIVVSNACISGLSALLAGVRSLSKNGIKYVIVVGADALCRFIISGFQSFKALAMEQCHPFDSNRTGLNLGEAAATMILSLDESSWEIIDIAVRNDANHISGPSRIGEGCYRAILKVLARGHDIAFINAHGTATLYNDEMESFAIERAGLSHIPVFSLKGYYGHTLGAAGLLECIISMQAIDDGVILPTRGYETIGVTHNITIADKLIPTSKHEFLKLISGFGGCNAALYMRKK